VSVAAGPRFTVVIPTYQRRASVVSAVQALARQQAAPPFEIVVVVDGSSDGTAEALRALGAPVTMRVLEQANAGASAARNAGARAARGELLLFLDDDMQADPGLLAAHDRSHSSGADVVVGHLPLDPRSRRNVVSEAVGTWAEQRAVRLSEPGAELTVHDLLTGQISVSAATFAEVGGFDTDFTRDGSFGGEDLDFGLRLLSAGKRVVFDPAAVTHQLYTVDPAHYLRQWEQAGHSDVVLLGKHPRQAAELLALTGAERLLTRRLWRPLVALPLIGALAPRVPGALATPLVRRGVRHAVVRRMFFTARHLAYLRGAHKAGGLPGSGHIVVLAYHEIAQGPVDPVMADYAVPPAELARQLSELRRMGYRFIDLDELIAAVSGERLMPDRGALVTFDDCYESLLTLALPLLEEHAAPAVAFAVSGRLGGTNTWDAHLGAAPLRLLDAGELRELVRRGVEVGAHTQTHPDLGRVAPAEAAAEIAGSLADLEAVGLPRPRSFAYPYGEHSDGVVAATRAAGARVAFTIRAGVVRAGADPHRLPRVELHPGDVGWRLRLKLAAAARASSP
jgi:peptidoglycan/xylan/chitin deacetylase (PgdA/CDA1 family)/GT2 family glycosyltransferase